MCDDMSLDGRSILLSHGLTAHATSLEDLVARGWDGRADTLGARHACHRDRTIITWLKNAVGDSDGPVLDVGCSYGNHVFMLNAALGKRPSVQLLGVDLDPVAVERANAFARFVDGYQNCSFSIVNAADGLPFESGAFRAVNLADVIEHMGDPVEVLTELARVTEPGGVVVVSTPLRDSLFKRAAVGVNRLSRGRLYQSYYSGKGSELDERGLPVMETQVGNDHVSEMTLAELRQSCEAVGLQVSDVELMSVMSGSTWFDDHPAILAGLLLVEALHEKLRRPSWAHSVVLRLTRAQRG
jgi:SAM-dependent methyltransferase